MALVVACIGALYLAAGGKSPAPLDMPFALTHLRLDLRIDCERGTVSGIATLRLRNVSGHAAPSVPLLLNRLMTVSGIATESAATIPFEQQIVVFQDDSIRQVTAVVATPKQPIPAGDSLALEVHYGGILVGYTETGSLYIKDHVSRDFTILREDAYAYPTLGVPSWQSNRMAPRPPFGFEARITVPQGLVVAMVSAARNDRRADLPGGGSHAGNPSQGK